MNLQAGLETIFADLVNFGYPRAGFSGGPFWETSSFTSKSLEGKVQGRMALGTEQELEPMLNTSRMHWELVYFCSVLEDCSRHDDFPFKE